MKGNDDGEHNDEEEDIPVAEESVEHSDGELEDDEKMDEDADDDKENKSNDNGDGISNDDWGGKEMKVDNDFEHVNKLYGYIVEDSVQTV